MESQQRRCRRPCSCCVVYRRLWTGCLANRYNIDNVIICISVVLIFLSIVVCRHQRYRAIGVEVSKESSGGSRKDEARLHVEEFLSRLRCSPVKININR